MLETLERLVEQVAQSLETLGFWLGWASEQFASSIYANWMPVTQEQLSLLLFVLEVLVILLTIIFAVLILADLLSGSQTSQEDQEEGQPVKATYQQMGVTRNGVDYELFYPAIAKLTRLDASLDDTGEFVGYRVETYPGLSHDNFLFLEGSWLRLATIQSLHHLDINRIESEIETGVRAEVDGENKQLRPPGRFEWNGEVWEVDDVYECQVHVIEGKLPSFPGGAGKIQYRFAVEAGESEEGQDILCLERQYNQFRRDINETWELFFLTIPSHDEVVAELEDIPERLLQAKVNA